MPRLDSVPTMKIVRVSYWTGEVPERVVLLRDPYIKGPFMYGVSCNELGVAHLEGCYGAEYAVKVASITGFEEIVNDAAKKA